MIEVFHGGKLFLNGYYPSFWTDNPLVAKLYGDQLWKCRLMIGDDAVVVEGNGRWSHEIWPTHAAHSNAIPETGVLVVESVHDYPLFEKQDELISTVFATVEVERLLDLKEISS